MKILNPGNQACALILRSAIVFLTGSFFGCGVNFNAAQLAALINQTPATTTTADPISFSPATGLVGSLLTITAGTGVDLSTTTGVSIGGVTATPVSVSSGTVVALVMPGTPNGVVSVTAGSTFDTTSVYTVTTGGVIANQQGAKLVGTGTLPTAHQGSSSALSADGNTMLVGGYTDNGNAGAVWAYTRSAGVWTQQGAKITPSDETLPGYFGTSVALSADGNTAMIGGYWDNTGVGAAWVFTRTAGVWTQQGLKLVGTGATGVAWQGRDVNLSADGNTAIVGGYKDNASVGAAWIYTRSGGVWTQVGAKLVGAGRVGASNQGSSVGLSADGTTAYVGGYSDNASVGAVWIYTLVAGTWTQQGAKLTATGETGAGQFGQSTEMSLDGNTIVAGAASDNAANGAAFVFTRTLGVWTQVGAKLIGTGNIGAAHQGRFVGISGDGNSLVSGGYNDNGGVGAMWTFTLSGGVWTQQGAKMVPTGYLGSPVFGLSIAMSKDGQTVAVGLDGENTNVGSEMVFTP
jgi:hypothetical protein